MASTIYSKAGADTAIAAAVDALVIPDSPDDIGAAAVAHTHTLAAITNAGDAAGLNVGTTADTVAAGDHTHAELHTHANTVALAAVSGTNTGDEPAASTTVAGIVELATTAEAATGTDTTRAVTPAGVAAAIAGVGGGVTDHGALTGLADDDHALYALADGTRGMFAATSHTHTASQISDSTATGRALITAATATAARTAISAAPALGSDDNYVTDAEKAALHTHPAVIAQGATAADARTAIGAGTSNLAIGTGATDAAPGNHDHDSRYLQPATPQAITAKTAAYTLVASDAGKLVQMTLTAAADLTVPASVFTAGQRVDLSDRGTARVTVVAGAGMTVNPPPGGTLVMEGRYAYASLVFVSATEADLVGLVAAA